MIGTYGAVFAVGWFGIDVAADYPSGLGLVGILLLVGLVSMAMSGGTAVLLERIAYRRLRKRGGTRLAALISAIGASLFLSELFAKWQGRDPVRFPRAIEPDPVFHVFGARVPADKFIALVAAIVMMIVLDRFVARTRLGRGIRAVAQDAQTATLMGVNIDRTVSVTFLLGGLMAGAAGMLFILSYDQTRYNIGFLFGVKAFTAAVLGGIGNLRGALIGGLALGLIETHGAAIFGGQWRDVIAFVVLVAVLMVRPTGILGESLGRARA
jgi:branched-chain amino acid transport system permease protein